MKTELEKFIAENRSSFDDRTPGDDVLSRIQQKIGHTAPAPEKKGIVISFKAIRWAAAACVIVLAGLGVWWMNFDTTKPTDQILAEQKPPVQDIEKKASLNPLAAIASETIAKSPAENIATKTDEQKTILFASLNNMESASTRLAAAMKVYEMKNADKEIVDALLTVMNTDPNTNVRLAALDALAKFHREPYVKKQLTAALKKQKDPMVQVELIQVLTKMKQTSILSELEKLVKDVNTTDAVKDRAYSSILTLGS